MTEDDAVRRERELAEKERALAERDRQRAEQAAEKERAAAERDRRRIEEVAAKARQAEQRQAERLERDRRRLEETAAKEAARRRAEHERAVAEAEREAAQARREADRAARDAELKAQRADRQAERVRLRAQAAGLATADDLPAPLAALWRTAEPPRRGPRPGLTLDGITDAAIALADAEGLRAVSMARVAEALGVTTMALYRYVTSKDELLGLMYEAAIADDPAQGVLAPPPPGTPAWRADLLAWCDRQLALTVRHPWLMQAVETIPALGPRRVAMLEAGLAALAGTGLPVALRVEVAGAASLQMLSEGVLLAAALAPRGPAGEEPPAGGAPGHPALLDYASLLRRLTTRETHPHVWAALDVDGFDAPVPDDGGIAFRIGLLLDGVAALIARTTAATAATTTTADEPVDD